MKTGAAKVGWHFIAWMPAWRRFKGASYACEECPAYRSPACTFPERRRRVFWQQLKSLISESEWVWHDQFVCKTEYFLLLLLAAVKKKTFQLGREEIHWLSLWYFVKNNETQTRSRTNQKHIKKNVFVLPKSSILTKGHQLIPQRYKTCAHVCRLHVCRPFWLEVVQF